MKKILRYLFGHIAPAFFIAGAVPGLIALSRPISDGNFQKFAVAGILLMVMGIGFRIGILEQK